MNDAGSENLDADRSLHSISTDSMQAPQVSRAAAVAPAPAELAVHGIPCCNKHRDECSVRKCIEAGDFRRA
ncbi:hypothetical protein [Noviherbaspirillum aerium]|uniref:hypothetical protein n=1 Tax=Noviherbaspirillum aerium TaxID=2588497 RepID=UPI00178C2586|nr:hypothetical protein [Noviherbaspirillum aerium]